MFETCKYELLNLKNWLQKKYFCYIRWLFCYLVLSEFHSSPTWGKINKTALNLFKLCKNYNWCLLFACAFTRLKYVGNVLIQLYFGICFTLSLRQKINCLRFYHRCIAFHRVQIRLNFFNISFCFKVRGKTMVYKLFLTVHILKFLIKFFCFGA